MNVLLNELIYFLGLLPKSHNNCTTGNFTKPSGLGTQSSGYLNDTDHETPKIMTFDSILCAFEMSNFGGWTSSKAKYQTVHVLYMIGFNIDHKIYYTAINIKSFWNRLCSKKSFYSSHNILVNSNVLGNKKIHLVDMCNE